MTGLITDVGVILYNAHYIISLDALGYLGL